MSTAKTVHLLSICGSLRRGSINLAVQKTLPQLAPDHVQITTYPQLHEIPMYNTDLQDQDGFPASVMKLHEAIKAADGVVIVSPEYNWSVTGVLKNAIDWLSRLKDQPFKDKPVALQSAAGGLLGGSRGQYHLRQILAGLEAEVFSKPEVIVNFAPKKIDPGQGLLIDEESRKMIQQQLDGFSKWIRRYAMHPHGHTHA